MTTPVDDVRAIPMTPDRWRAVEVVLQAALTCAPNVRGAFVAEACEGDAGLRREVESLLAAHDHVGDFLDRPAAEGFGIPPEPPPFADRLAAALEGRYAIEREIGRGGMAVVYLARDLRHDRRVAIKVLRDELAAAVGAERFLEEIRVTASLQHPHILPLFDSGSVNGLLWYVMPHIEGETLRVRLERDGRLPVDTALQIVREIADGLDYAHRQGVVHRDVKPENVLLQGGHAVVADFGIALALEHAGGARLTSTGIAIGTPQYMAPEQASGGQPIDARTDVYALGAVLHEMLAGESPFAAPSPHAVMWRVMHEPATALASRRPDVAPFLDAAVRKALAKRPDDRFQGAAAFAAALVAPEPSAASAAAASRGAAPHAEWREWDPHTGRDAPRGGRVPARAALYFAGAMLAVGLAGGFFLARTPWIERLTSGRGAAVGAPAGVASAQQQPLAADRTLGVFDRSGRLQQTIVANRAWTPRISPDGHHLVYGAFGAGRSTSDLWMMDLDAGTTQRLTNDDRDSNDPQWSPDGKSIAYSVSAPDGKDVMVRSVAGGDPRVLMARPGVQFPSDWLHDGSALLVTDYSNGDQHDILVQPANGSAATSYAVTAADETAARISPDGRWIAYTSNETGREEVYLDSYPRRGQRVAVSPAGGLHPVWRADGKELYYWKDGELMAVQVGTSAGDARPTLLGLTALFRAAYQRGPNTMYDVSPDGQRFVIVREW